MNIITATLPYAFVGKSYAVQLQAIDGTAPYTWAVVVGALPMGFSLSSSGLLSASLIGNIKPQAYSFSIRCTDSAAATDTDAYTLTVFPGHFERTPLYLLDERLLSLLDKAVLPSRAITEQHFARAVDGFPHKDVDVKVPAWLGGSDTDLRTVLNALSAGGGSTQAIAEPTVTAVDPSVDGAPINSHDYPILLARDTAYTTQMGINSDGYTSLGQTVTFAQDVYDEITIGVKLQRMTADPMTGETVTVGLYTDDSGAPDTLVDSANISISDIDDEAPAWYTVSLDAGAAITAGVYHIVVSGSYTVSLIDYVSWCVDEVADYDYGHAEAYSIGDDEWQERTSDFTFTVSGSYDSVDFLMEIQIDATSYIKDNPYKYFGLREPLTLSVIWNETYSSQLVIKDILDAPGDSIVPDAYQVDSDGFITGNRSPGSGGGHVGYFVTLIIGYAYQPGPILPTDAFDVLYAAKKTVATLNTNALIAFGIPAATTEYILSEISRLKKRAGRVTNRFTYTMTTGCSPDEIFAIILPSTPSYPSETQLFVGVKFLYGVENDFYVLGDVIHIINSSSRYVLEQGDILEIIYYTDV